jgi:membrane fusion protein, copper/silver efflux system
MLSSIFVAGCKQNDSKHDNAHQHKAGEQYTCPMHPQIVKDKAGTCPICGMDLVPSSSSHQTNIDSSITRLLKSTNQQVVSSIPTIRAESGTKIFSMPAQGIITYDTRREVNISSRVSGRIERLYIKYNFQPVRKGQLIMEIYSPDLAAAQRELVFIHRNNDEGLLQKAKQRLLLLGMQPAQINSVIKTGKPLYRVPVHSNTSGYIFEKSSSGSIPSSPINIATENGAAGMEGMGSSQGPASQEAVSNASFNNTPVIIREGQYVSAGQSIFTIYREGNLVAEFSFPPALAAEIKTGQKFVFRPSNNADDVKAATIGLIQPTQRNGENFTVVRAYLQNPELQPGQLIVGHIPIVQTKGWWIASKAVYQSGNNSIIFKKEKDVFVPYAVQTGAITNDYVQVLDDISSWEIAANAHFLVDSESFIKAKRIKNGKSD